MPTRVKATAASLIAILSVMLGSSRGERPSYMPLSEPSLDLITGRDPTWDLKETDCAWYLVDHTSVVHYTECAGQPKNKPC